MKWGEGGGGGGGGWGFLNWCSDPQKHSTTFHLWFPRYEERTNE